MTTGRDGVAKGLIQEIKNLARWVSTQDTAWASLARMAGGLLFLPLALALVFLSPFLYLPKMIAIILLSTVTKGDSDYWDRKLDMWWQVPWAVIGAAFWVTIGMLLALG